MSQLLLYILTNFGLEVATEVRENQNLRILVEKYYKHTDLTISSICKQMLEECKE